MVDHLANGGAGQPQVGAAQRTVASLSSLGAAELTARRLSLEGVPADRIAVVGHDLQTVARVVGRVSAAVTVARAALLGALVSAAVSWLLTAVDLAKPSVVTVWLVIDSALVGGAIGAVVALVAHALTRGRRGVGTDDGVRVGRYDIMADAEVADHVAYVLRTEQSAGHGVALGQDAGGKLSTEPGREP